MAHLFLSALYFQYRLLSIKHSTKLKTLFFSLGGLIQLKRIASLHKTGRFKQ